MEFVKQIQKRKPKIIKGTCTGYHVVLRRIEKNACFAAGLPRFYFILGIFYSILAPIMYPPKV